MDLIQKREQALILDPALKDRWDRAIAVIQLIDLTALQEWFRTLAQALEEGRFDEEYNRLLSEGLDKFVEAVSILAPTDSEDHIKKAVREIASFMNTPTPPLPPELVTFLQNSSDRDYVAEILGMQDRVRGTLKILFATLQAAHLAGELVPILGDIISILDLIQALVNGQPRAPYDLINDLINQWDSAMLRMMLYGYSQEQLWQFSTDIYDIIRSLFPSFIWDFPLPIATNDHYLKIAELWGFLNWLTSTRGTALIQERVDQVWGTIHVAANSVRQGWEYKGLMPNTYNPYGETSELWWGTILRLNQGPSGRSILAVSRGDNCAECDSKASEIVEWTARAIELVSSGAVEGYIKTLDRCTG